MKLWSCQVIVLTNSVEQEAALPAPLCSKLLHTATSHIMRLLSEFRVSVIALRWVVCSVFYDKGNFTAINFAVVCGIGKLFKYFFSDGKVSSLLPGKVLFNKLTIGTSKVVKCVGKV